MMVLLREVFDFNGSGPLLVAIAVFDATEVEEEMLSKNILIC